MFLIDRKSREGLVLLIGAFAGLLLAWLVCSLWPVSYEALERARSLGIVSITILSDYPKAMEVHYYLIFLALTFACAFGFYLTYSRLSSSGAVTKDQIAPPLAPFVQPMKRSTYVLIALAAIYLFFYKAYFTGPPISPWYLFGEQGENLSWASAILSGQGSLQRYLLPLRAAYAIRPRLYDEDIR